jgi:hypothetical protein
MSEGADANFIYSEIPVGGEVQSSQRATPDELVGMAKKIWAEVRRSKVGRKDDAANDELLERLQEKYKDFQTSFPIVLRWMVQRREFTEKAFRRYLVKHASAKMDKREEFLELQAEYVIMLYRDTHPHANEEVVRRYRLEVNRHLKAEDKTFMDVSEEVEKDLTAREKTFDADRRRKLYDTLMAGKASAATAPSGVASSSAVSASATVSAPS